MSSSQPADALVQLRLVDAPAVARAADTSSAIASIQLPSPLPLSVDVSANAQPANTSAAIVSIQLPSPLPLSVDAPAVIQPADTPSAIVLPPVPSVDLPSTSSEAEMELYKPSLATHANRNSSSVVQSVRILSKLSDAQKASQKLRRTIEQKDRQKLIEDFDTLLERHSNEQAELAKLHNVQAEYLDKLKTTSKHYRVKRDVNLENAKIHKKSIEINADRDVGNRLRITDLRQLVKDDPNLQNLSKAQETELREELLASRAQKRLGARPTNRSAAQDYRRQLEQLNNDINSLTERTGAAAVCFFTRTSLEDTFEPNWICTPNAANFTEDSLNRNMWDIARLFEQWGCSKPKVRKPESFGSLREQCSKLINGGLKTASKLGTAAMNYQNYNTQIISRLGVKLVGWTYHKLVSPYEIHTIDDLRTLHDALVCGACFWMRLSKGEMTRHKADLEKREAEGEVVTKKRKERSDKGVPKGPRKKVGGQMTVEVSDDNEDQAAGPSKKRKVETWKKGKGKAVVTKKAAPKTQVPPSNEFLDNTDLEDYE